jgi:uncharacterized protein (TIGR03118 family)
MNRSLTKILMTAACAAGLLGISLGGGYAADFRYMVTPLISNNTNMHPAALEDTTLLNPWGIAFFPGGPFWINDNNFGISALYDGLGDGIADLDPAPAVTIPPPNGGTPPAAPTGIVANTSFTFNLADGKPAAFIFDTEDGTISAWDGADGIPGVIPGGTGTAELEVDNSTEPCSDKGGAVYKGLALGVNPKGVFLYATNFRCATVDVFTGMFKPATLDGNFADPGIPNGFAPFGIANIRGNLFVTYAKQNDQKHDDVAGEGNGFVDIFDTDGHFIERFATRGKLNSPWAVTEAPSNFGRFSNDILIGNFGDGEINGIASNGQVNGTLRDTSDHPIMIDGLWSLVFGGGSVSSPSALYFTSGPDGEMNGLVGTITPQ